MQIVTSLTKEELKELITESVRSCLDTNLPPQPELSDRCQLKDACEITGLSRAAIYKLTSARELPHMKFGQRLVFSRRVLAAWVNERTVLPVDPSQAIKDGLKKSANKKLRNEAQ